MFWSGSLRNAGIAIFVTCAIACTFRVFQTRLYRGRAFVHTQKTLVGKVYTSFAITTTTMNS